jgi:translocation and assembly module TamB
VELRGDYNVDAAFDTSSISLQPLVAAYIPSQATNVTGKTEIHAKIRGPLTDQSRLDAHLTIPVFDVHYRNMVDLAAANPIQMDYTKGVLTIQPAAIRGTGTDIQIEGKIPTNGTDPASVRAVGTVDLRVAELFDPDITSSGQLKLNVDGTGSRSNANVQGQIEIVNANFASGDAPLGLQNGNGLLRLTNTGLEIDRFQATVGNGTLTAKGGVSYRPSVRFNLTATTNGIRLSYPHGVRETLDANLTLTGTPQKGALQGQVHLQQISFARDFDIAELIGELSANTAAPQGMANNLELDISVRSSDSTSVVTGKLNLDAAANLQVRGTAANPVLIGRMNVESGDLIFRGNRYVLQPSSVEFVNPYETEPNLNLAVETKVQAYNIQMRMRGTMDHLQTTYTSDPALPPADIINLLVFGKTNEAADANPQPFNLGAESFLASQVSGQLTNRVEKVAGISQLSIDPVLGGNQKNPGARISIQQRVTGNLFVAFSTDPTSTERQVVKLEYQVSPKMSVSGVRDQNGGFAFDVRMKKSW